MEWAVWYIAYDMEHNRVWRYKVFDTEREAWEWFRYMREPLKYPEELATIERPVPFVDGRPQKVYVDRGCEGQISMFELLA